MLVRVIKDWEAPDLFRQTPNHDGIWEGIRFTENPLEKCDALVVLNRVVQDEYIHVPPEQTLLLTQEPPVASYEWHTRAFNQYGKVLTQHSQAGFPQVEQTQSALPWWVGKTYKELTNLSPAKAEKQDRLSTITSNAYERPGHILRYDLIQYLAEHLHDLALFGKGIQYIEDKFDGIYPFKYSLAIENSFYPHYWTEKLTDCFLSWTMPVYAGAPNIREYFPAESMILIDPRDQQGSLAIIQEAIREDKWSKHLEAISEARNLILNKYQFFPWVAKHLQQQPLDASPAKWLHFQATYSPEYQRPSLLRERFNSIKTSFELLKRNGPWK